MYRNYSYNRCRAELGWCPMLINIQKRIFSLWCHLNQSSKHSLHHKALEDQKLYPNENTIQPFIITLRDQQIQTLDQQNKQSKLRDAQNARPAPKPPINKSLGGININSGKLACYRSLHRVIRPVEYVATMKHAKPEVEMRMYKEQFKSREMWLHGQCDRGQNEKNRHFLFQIWVSEANISSNDLELMTSDPKVMRRNCLVVTERYDRGVTLLHNLPPDQQWSTMTNGSGGQDPKQSM